MRVCLCELAGVSVAIPVSAVEEVFALGSVTPVPGAPPWVLGATSRRGRVLPVLRLPDLPTTGAARPGASVLVLREGELRAAIPIEATHGIQEALPLPGGAPAAAGPLQGAVSADGRSWSLLSPGALAGIWTEEVRRWTTLDETER
ncbi:MAG: chemotaxis protein CheW [Deltaproteobacteria bacterium]|nr:chemotaxis protein CheW [Deltaproteobacteria bacterium]